MSARRTRRVSLALATAAALGASLLTLAAPAQATSSIGGQISSAEILSRAQSWVDKHVPYNQQGYATDPQGTNYREDCSGYVSMAWHLDKSLVVTDGGPAFTNADGSPNSAYDTAVGSFSNLQPGDAMAYPHQHVFLFAGWTNKAAGDFVYYADSNTNDPTHGPSKANIHDSSIEGWPTSGYVALRYKNVSNAPTIPAGFNVAIDAGGTAASGQTVSGTVNLTALASASGYINTGRYVITGPGGYNTGQLTPSAGGASNYPYAWNTAGLAAGTYQISFVANETDGQDHTYGPVNVTIAAPMPRSSSSGLSARSNGGYVTAWRGGDGYLWVGTGSGTNMAQPDRPWLLGVAQGSKPSIATMADGSWATAWAGNDGRLWIATGNGTNMAQPAEPWLLGVYPGTSPAITALSTGGWEIAWKGADGNLWVATGNGTNMAQPAAPWLLGVADTTSPSLAALPGGGYEVAWKGNDGYLWLATGNGTNMAQPARPWLLGVGAAGSSSSPSIATMADGSYEVAWKGGDGNLWVATGNGTNMAQPAAPWLLGVADTTSPSLAALPNGGYEVAWKGNDGYLWLATGNGTNMAQPDKPWLLGVGAAGTSYSPSLASLPGGGYEVAWKGGDGYLWLATGSGTNMAQPAEPWLLGVA
ncbi:hypothetical protein [Streptomyces sp. CBMA156]|uniref:hypothetical protein n=1 Tax=Streptomyces sp. CBMA156 TaxID=1930280 RepID=UPI001661D3E6|nr:hypothetical protein [Streptomyces sp. CBMA156]MBD0670204.1 hypothetical protein [Streptomyces sp. CBMA156]